MRLNISLIGSPLLEQLDSAFSSSSTKIIGHLGKELRMWEMPVCDAPTWHFAPLYLCRHDITWDMGRTWQLVNIPRLQLYLPYSVQYDMTRYTRAENNIDCWGPDTRFRVRNKIKARRMELYFEQEPEQDGSLSEASFSIGGEGEVEKWFYL
ncbi:hypothetical protein Cgig2_010460 [Carnegiea gigantea]|uniref:Uncharacterized protein n=1 Tax=Carnegiea gigantea TaxID=171969 RepID=A0A9Q1QAW7_9CARY|nr:hypothetical protein Cgig2_010460 [Carnegiea gigantea]